MKLLPAIKSEGKLFVGDERDSHSSIALREHIKAPEKLRGFTPDGKIFLTRKQALGWLKAHDIKTFRKLPSKAHYEGLHSEQLAKARGIEQKEKAQELRLQGDDSLRDGIKGASKRVNLKDKKVLMYDRGLYLYLAEKLAETFDKIYYYLPQSDPYPSSNLYNIATGIEGVERTHDFWGMIDKVDLIIFADTYDGSLQNFLRKKGYRVFGSGLSEKVETDKIFFMETLEESGLPVPRTYLAEGVDDLIGYLKKEGGPKWLKGMTRGDFETKKFEDMDHFMPFLDDLRFRLGKRTETIEILVQDPIDSKAEVGYDGFCVNGEFTGNCLCGYEIKDRSFVAAVVKEPAPLVKEVNDAFAPTFKKLGYNGAYSTEIRVTKEGIGYYIDPTTRFGSPPGELMSELYENYGEILWQCAEGVLPMPKPKKKFGAQMILTSDWYREDHEMYVEFPDKFRDNIKLSNYYRRDGKTFIVPNDTEQYFGSVVAIGDTIDEAIEKVNKVLESIVCEKFKYDKEAFEEAREVIEAAEKLGVPFG